MYIARVPAKTRTTSPTRRYSSQRRSQQAAQTRRDVLTAAVKLFGETGWSATTLAAIAAEAGVAVETIYSGFGSKKALLRAAMDVSIVGDDLPVPLAERSDYLALAEGEPAERVRRGAQLQVQIYARSAGVWNAMRDAAAGDHEVAAWCAELEHNRRIELQRSLKIVLGHPVEGKLLDLLWTLLGPETYTKLVVDRGWSTKIYEQWMTKAVLQLTAS